MKTNKQTDQNTAPQLPFKLDEASRLLARTPKVLAEILSVLPDAWMRLNEGGKSWSPHEILAHLVFGEQTDRIPRVRLFMESTGDLKWDPFYMGGHKVLAEGNSTEELLSRFGRSRKAGLEELRALSIGETELEKTCIHPALGKVTLRNHLSAWVAHDLGHIAQITRVIAKHYREEVGSWAAYMSVLNDRVQ